MDQTTQLILRYPALFMNFFQDGKLHRAKINIFKMI